MRTFAMAVLTACVLIAQGSPAQESSSNSASFAASDQKQVTRSVVIINTGRGGGTGFLCKLGGTNYVVTNSHVLENATQFNFQLSEKGKLSPLRLDLADDRDLARILVAEQDQPALSPAGSVELGAPIAVYGNSEGMKVITKLTGTVEGVGAERVEVNAAFVAGNSGSPIVDAQGAVVGVATFITRSASTNWVTQGTRFTQPRRFGVRVTPDIQWVTVSAGQFLQEAAVLSDIETFLSDSWEIVRLFRKHETGFLREVATIANTGQGRYNNPQYRQQLKNYCGQLSSAIDAYDRGIHMDSASVKLSLQAAGITFKRFPELPLRQLRENRFSTQYYRTMAKEYEEVLAMWKAD